MAGSPPVHRKGRDLRATAAALFAAAGTFGRQCGRRPRRILDAPKSRYEALGAVNLKAANQRFLAKIFIAVGGTLAVAGSEI
jgi:hypothetical protein